MVELMVDLSERSLAVLKAALLVHWTAVQSGLLMAVQKAVKWELRLAATTVVQLAA